jgi:hypothetical protein
MDVYQLYGSLLYAGSCECGNEPSCELEIKFVDQLSDY